MRRAQAAGYACLGVLGLVVVFAVGRPLWAGLPGLVIATIWLALIAARPPRLNRMPSPRERPIWVYVLTGPLAFFVVAAAIVAIAWLVGRHLHQSGLAGAAGSVLSAFALGTAAFFARVEIRS